MKTFDDVSGVIIGGDYVSAWLTYEGRKQAGTTYAETKQDADAALLDVVEMLKKDFGEAFKMIYPNPDGWKIHYDGC